MVTYSAEILFVGTGTGNTRNLIFNTEFYFKRKKREFILKILNLLMCSKNLILGLMSRKISFKFISDTRLHKRIFLV